MACCCELRHSNGGCGSKLAVELSRCYGCVVRPNPRHVHHSEIQEGDFAGGILAGTEELARVLKSDPEACARFAEFWARTGESRPQRNALVATSGVGVAALVLTVIGFMFAVRRLYSTTAFIAVTASGLIVLAIASWLTFRAEAASTTALLGGTTAATLGAWGFNLLKYRRYGPHGCSKCGTHLELLSEQDDDPKLSSRSAAGREDRLGRLRRVDLFGVLKQRHRSLCEAVFRIQNCPACKARTFKSDPQEVLVPATTVSAGGADRRAVRFLQSQVRAECHFANATAAEFVEQYIAWQRFIWGWRWRGRRRIWGRLQRRRWCFRRLVNGVYVRSGRRLRGNCAVVLTYLQRAREGAGTQSIKRGRTLKLN